MKQKNKSGFSLVEILLAILILAFLAVGGAAVLYQTGSGILVQGNKRVALELANQRLEVALAQNYYDIVPEEYNEEGTYYLLPSNTDEGVLEQRVTGQKHEKITYSGRVFKMYTEVVRWSAGQPSTRNSFEPEHMEVRVSVQFGSDGDDTVVLSTVVIPPVVAL